MWEGRNRPDMAREMLDKLFRVNPDHPEGLALLGLIEARSSTPDRTKDILARLKRVAPSHKGVVAIETQLRIDGPDKGKLLAARQLAQRSKLGGQINLLPRALAAFEEVFGPDGIPDGDIALEYWNHMAFDDDNWARAMAGLDGLKRRNPDNLRFRLAWASHRLIRFPSEGSTLAAVIELANHPELQRGARDAWRRALFAMEARPENRGYLLAYRELDTTDQPVVELIKEFDRRVETAESLRLQQNDPAYIALEQGKAHFAVGRVNEAGRSFERGLRLSPDNPDLLGNLGVVRLRQGHAVLASALLESAVSKSGTPSEWSDRLRDARVKLLLSEVTDARGAGLLELANEKIKRAYAVDPKSRELSLSHARLLASQGDIGGADRVLRAYIDRERLDPDAWLALVKLYAVKGQQQRARTLVAELPVSVRKQLVQDLVRLDVEILRADAAELADRGQNEEAIDVLFKAVELAPNDPWLVFELTRHLVRVDRRTRAEQMFDELQMRNPDDADTFYAFALFKSLLDEEEAALFILEGIPQTGRTAKLTQFQRGLWLRYRLRQVLDASRSGLLSIAERDLADLERQASGDKMLLLPIAKGWADIGDSGRARQLVNDRLGTELSSMSIDWRLDRAKLLAQINLLDELELSLAGLSATAGLSAQEHAALRALEVGLLVRRAEELALAGNHEAAIALLAKSRYLNANNVSVLLAEARSNLALGRERRAEGLARQALLIEANSEPASALLFEALRAGGDDQRMLAEIDRQIVRATAAADDQPNTGTSAGTPDKSRFSSELYRRKVDILMTAGKADDALQVLNSALKENQSSVELWLALMQWQGRFGSHADLQAVLTSLPDDIVSDPRINRLAIELAEGILAPFPRLRSLQNVAGKTAAALEDGKLSTLRLEHSTEELTKLVVSKRDGKPELLRESIWREIAGLADSQATWLAGAVDQRDRQGTAGISQYRATEIPLELSIPSEKFSGKWVFRADEVWLDAGQLQFKDEYSSRRFGTYNDCFVRTICNSPVSASDASGTAFNVALLRPDMRIDIGTTPLGFPVQNWVGGLYSKGDIGDLGYSIDVSRRSLTGSVLSYAGVRDLPSGQTWGGVVSSGVRIGLSADEGGSVGLWSSLGYHRLTGKNVAENKRTQLMGGGYWRIINEVDRQMTIGLTAMQWRFAENLGEYSLGHGGYFSPARFISTSFPVTYSQRNERLSLSVRASVSGSRSRTGAANFYPVDTQRQLRAVEDFANNIENTVAPTYSASDGISRGRGHSFHVGIEYQLTPYTFIGGRLEIDRSIDYSPNRALLYLRYNADRAAANPVLMPPEALFPTSQY
jgi:tetratricopeptide (TPR) repeat protein